MVRLEMVFSFITPLTLMQETTLIKKNRGISIKSLSPGNTSSLILFDSPRTNSIKILLNQMARSYTFPSKFVYNVLIGLLLGDGHLSLSWSSKNAFFVFVQSLNRFKYAWHIYELLGFYVSPFPVWINPDVIKKFIILYVLSLDHILF